MPLSQWFSFRCDTLIDRIKTIIYEGIHFGMISVPSGMSSTACRRRPRSSLASTSTAG